ncbi:MAG: hypothetical protein ACE15D_18075 [Candidatus Eisenbacteria bacterium]
MPARPLALAVVCGLAFVLTLAIPARARPAEPETVAYTTADGFRVVARYYRPAAPASFAAVILPDPAEGKEAWSFLADTLLALGYHVLVPDLRGTGESALRRGVRRDRSRFTAAEIADAGLDAAAALHYFRDLPATSIRGVAWIGSGAGNAALLHADLGGPERAVRILVSPRIEDTEVSPLRSEGPLLVVVENDDLPGIEASASLVPGHTDRRCWLIEGVGRGAELLRSRGDWISTLTSWIERSLTSE